MFTGKKHRLARTLTVIVLALTLCSADLLGIAPVLFLNADALSASGLLEYAYADNDTSSIEDVFAAHTAANDGRVMTDKTVVYNDDVCGAYESFAEDEFGVTLSALSQSYTVEKITNTTSDSRVHADVVFIIDTSYSMETNNIPNSNLTRATGCVNAVNEAIANLMANDPETRIGVVSFASKYWAKGLRLDLDSYTLPAGDTQYILHEQTRTMGTISVPDAEIISSALLGSDTYKYIYLDGTAATENDTSKARVYVDSTGAYKFYVANSTSVYKSGTVEDNTYVLFDDYALLRTGSKYYLYSDLETETRNVNKTFTGTVGKVVTGTSTWSNGTVVNGQTYYIRRYSNYSKTTVYINTSKSTTNAPTISPGKTKTINGIVFSNDSSGTVTYSYNAVVPEEVLKTTTMQVPVTAAGESCTFYSSALLEDSDGNSVPQTSIKSEGIYGVGGTYTQAGLKAAEEMFLAVQNDGEDVRVPVIVLVTDGVPTICNSDWEHLTAEETGTGLNNETENTYGLYTIQTAADVKHKVDDHYTGETALFYTIAPGVNGNFGKTVIDPSPENLAACNGDNTPAYSGSDGRSPGTAAGLRNLLVSTLSAEQLAYVDYADWSVAGNLTEDELREGFDYIISNISRISRPVSDTTVVTAAGEDLVSGEYLVFTDVLGDDMELRGLPVLSYNDCLYDSVKLGDNDFCFTGSVIEPSTGESHPLTDLRVHIDTDENGKKTLYWAIPSDLIPVVLRKSRLENGVATDAYYDASPIRLSFKVGVEDIANKTGVFYTNDYTDGNVTSVAFTPSVGNPYYYSFVENGNGEKTAVWKGEDNSETVLKNPEQVEPAADCVYSVIPGEENGITILLGNNGVLALNKAVFGYELYLVDRNGTPIDEDEDTVTFANRTVMSEVVTTILGYGDDITVDEDLLEELLPDGYAFYNPAAVLDFIYSTKTSSTITVSDSTNTTKIYNDATPGGFASLSAIRDYSELYAAFAIFKDYSLKADVVVIDYGLPVVIDLTGNDDIEGGSVTGISSEVASSVIINTKRYKTSMLAGDKAKPNDTLTLAHGTARLTGDTVKYTPTDMRMTAKEVFYYEFTTSNGGKFYTTVTVVPATILYYEESFVTFTDTTNNKWKISTGENDGENQAQDRPGYDEVLADFDADNVYGYDEANLRCTTYSNGSARYVKVANGDYAANGNKWPTASFTFTGNAFDLIAMSSKYTGFITVEIYQGDEVTSSAYKHWTVDAYYGYTRNIDGYVKHEWYWQDGVWHVRNEIIDDVDEIPESEMLPTNIESCDTSKTYVTYEVNYNWEPVESNEDNAIYQIPLIKSPVLPYGTYTVVITPSYSTFCDHNKIGYYSFYVDAVRVYEPAEDYDVYNYEYYTRDNEGWPQFLEIRDNLITASDMEESDEINGVVFIDSVAEDTATGDYRYYGPNNEVYLAPGQSIAFVLECEDNGRNVDTVQIGVKRLTGTNAQLTATAGSAGKIKQTRISVSASTDMYYNICDGLEWSDNESEIIVVTNTSSAYESLTNIKITYYAKPVAPASFAYNSDNASIAVSLAQMIYIASVSECYHRYEYSIVTMPTETSEGLIRAVCLDCGNTFEMVAPAINSGAYTETERQLPTESEDGYAVFTWNDGEITVRVEYPATGSEEELTGIQAVIARFREIMNEILDFIRNLFNN